jgi:small RNA 2'-O-methyltransferase
VTTWLHEQRLDAVYRAVSDSGARRILDLGCGDGDLLVRLIRNPAIQQIVAVDVCGAALARLSQRLAENAEMSTTDVRIVHGSLLEVPRRYPAFDCAVLVEVIEHIDPARLSALEQAVFVGARPDCVVVTTPNAEFNPLLGVPASRFRHRDHRFEWERARFRRWAEGVAGRTGYEVSCVDIGSSHPVHGGASQMGLFRLLKKVDPKALPHL